MLYYAGIGSRSTPQDVCALMNKCAQRLEELNFILRSGAALGADAAFEAGVSDPAHKEIFLPWAGYNGSESKRTYAPAEAFYLAAAFHPAWDKCSTGAKKMHTRNCMQILGQKLDTPVSFVLCWTKGGKHLGGTAQALRIAQHNGIEIINFANPQPLQRIAAKLDSLRLG